MRIVSAVGWRDWKPLDAYKAGTPVRFRQAFHQSLDDDDIFIVNEVCASYRPDDCKYRGKIAVTHLKTGKLSYLQPDRECCHVQAIVRLEEDVC